MQTLFVFETLIHACKAVTVKSVKVFCALYLFYLNAFEMAVSGGRIDTLGWPVCVGGEERRICSGNGSSGGGQSGTA